MQLSKSKALLIDPADHRKNTDDSTARSGGDGRDRTADPLLAKQVLSQLSYIPKTDFRPSYENRPLKHGLRGIQQVSGSWIVTLVLGASGIEPLTPALSARCSTN